jgi:hypothetical protein
MNKKKWVNSKIIITITMVFVGCCFILTSLWAAKKIDFHPATVVDTYCDSYADDQSFEWIAGVHVMGSYINNTSGPSSYSNFTHISACLYKNEYVSVLLTPGFGRDPYKEYWKIWVDYNHDDDFSDPGEEVFSGTSPKKIGAFLHGNFAGPVPTSAINGQTRMRVSMKYGGWPSDCAAYDYGEVEDYSVNIVDRAEPLGNTTVFEHISTNDNRRAMPFTMPRDGYIVSAAMYHKAGSGKMILGVYDGEDAPQNLIGLTPETDVKGSDCWQVIMLTNTVHVAAGTTVWLAWVYEDNPGTAYTSIEPASITSGRYDAGVGWSGGMPETFGSGTQADYIYSIYAIWHPYSYPSCGQTVGNTDVYENISTMANRRAMPFTMPMEGSLVSVVMYHMGGTGSMILAVYDGDESPQNRLAITEITPVHNTEGWQEIKLTHEISLLRGDTFWLAWVYENNPGIRYKTGSLGRYQSDDTWSGGMPYYFGSGSQENYIYSIYLTYKPD